MTDWAAWWCENHKWQVPPAFCEGCDALYCPHCESHVGHAGFLCGRPAQGYYGSLTGQACRRPQGHYGPHSNLADDASPDLGTGDGEGTGRG